MQTIYTNGRSQQLFTLHFESVDQNDVEKYWTCSYKKGAKKSNRVYLRLVSEYSCAKLSCYFLLYLCLFYFH